MIGSLRGVVLEKALASVLFEVQGIGYRIKVAPAVLSGLKTQTETFLYIHDHIREDAHDLYGFVSQEDLDLFERLLSISGVGPKVAMTILSVGSAETVRRAIMSGDLGTLTSVPGVGKKTAQKIVLELKGQLVEAEGAASNDEREVMEALEALGYSSSQAREALKVVPAEITDTAARLRAVLKRLSK